MTSYDDIFDRIEELKDALEFSSFIDQSKLLLLHRELTILMAKHNFLSNSADSIAPPYRLMFREILELSMIMYYKLEKYSELHLTFSQLGYFYFDNNDLPQSQRMFTIIGMILLYYLSAEQKQNYSLILMKLRSKLPNLYIQFVLDVENSISLNSISKLQNLLRNSPSSYFDIFLKQILKKCRKSLFINLSHTNILSKADLEILKLEEDEYEPFLMSCGYQLLEDGKIVIANEEEDHQDNNEYALFDHVYSYAVRFSNLMPISDIQRNFD